MATKKYWDRVKAKVFDILETLNYQGTDVLTPTYSSGRGLRIINVKDPVDPQDVMTKHAFDTGAPGGGILKVNGILPDGSGNAEVPIESILTAGNVSTKELKVPEKPYATGWGTDTSVPTRKDVYNEMENRVVKVTDHSLIPDEVLATILTLKPVVAITLPSSTTVAGRVSGAVEGVDYPVGWVLSAGTSPVDLKIVHNQDANIANVMVLSIAGSGEERLLAGFSVGYTGVLALNKNELLIEALSELQTGLRIVISFV